MKQEQQMKLHYPVISEDNGVSRLACTYCGKSVSTGFVALPTESPDRGLIVRAVIECPECLQVRAEKENDNG